MSLNIAECGPGVGEESPPTENHWLKADLLYVFERQKNKYRSKLNYAYASGKKYWISQEVVVKSELAEV